MPDASPSSLPPTPPDRIWLGGVACDPITDVALFNAIAEQVENHDPTQGGLLVSSFNLVNIGNYGVDAVDECFFDDSTAAGRRWLMIIDGAPVASAATKLTGETCPKLSGSDLFPLLMDQADRHAWSVGFLGGTAETNTAFAELAAERWPHVRVASWSPARQELMDESPRLAAEIHAAGVDLLVLSLPKPISEHWMHDYGTDSGAAVLLALGASVDFQVGSQTRAPKIFQRLHGEWFWRLLKEPARMWRRYLLEGPGEARRLRKFQGRSPVCATPLLWRRRIGRTLALADAMTMALASLLAVLSRLFFSSDFSNGYAPSWATLVMTIPVLVALIGLLGGRRPKGVRIDGRLYTRFLGGLAAGLASIGLISYAFHLNTARGYVGLLAVFGLVGGSASRLSYAWWLDRSRRRGRNLVRILGVGSNPALADLLDWFSSHPTLGYRVVDRLTDLPDRLGSPVGVLAVDGSDPGMIRDADELARGSAEVMVVPDLVSVDASRLQPDTFADRSVLHLAPIELYGTAALAKRILDVVLATAALLVAAVPLAIATWMIKREDGGPVLFRQTRIGRDGVPFSVLKLRTMAVDAEARLDQLKAQNEAGPYLFKMENDPRITAVGGKLRSWSLDELPQLWNVLRGDMSLVGPRPALPSEVDLFPTEAHRRHRVRPGLTGLWQVSGRSDLDSTQALALDLHYVANWSLAGDLSILLRTVRTVATREGAH